MRNAHESGRKGLEWPRGCGGSTWQHGGLAAVDEIRANAGHGQRASDPHDYRRLRNSRRSRHSEPYLTKSEVRLRRPKVTPQFDKQGVRRVHTTPEYAGSRWYGPPTLGNVPFGFEKYSLPTPVPEMSSDQDQPAVVVPERPIQ